MNLEDMAYELELRLRESQPWLYRPERGPVVDIVKLRAKYPHRVVIKDYVQRRLNNDLPHRSENGR